MEAFLNELYSIYSEGKNNKYSLYNSFYIITEASTKIVNLLEKDDFGIVPAMNYLFPITKYGIQDLHEGKMNREKQNLIGKISLGDYIRCSENH